MKSLKQVLEASILDIDANLDVTDTDIIKDIITQFINDNYITKEFIISDKLNKDGKFEVSSKYKVVVKNKNITSLTNDLFVWDVVNGYFDCFACISLQSLEGAPKEVGGDFNCAYCNSLQSLEGAPKEVGDGFYCYDCKSLKSLKEAPEFVGGKFDCSGCNFKESDVRAVSNVKGKIVV